MQIQLTSIGDSKPVDLAATRAWSMLAAMSIFSTAAFAPIVGQDPRVLILGSMPSQQSLAKQEYYGNPRNAFWWLMENLLECEQLADKRDKPLSYAQRVELVTSNRIAIWDVLADCERPGSLDSNIIRSSEKANDFLQFIAQHSTIELIGFNGGAAKTIFMRHCAEVLVLNSNIEWVQLPSTSPAHAALSKQQKLAQWRLALSTHL